MCKFRFFLIFFTWVSFITGEQPLPPLVQTHIREFMEKSKAPGVSLALYFQGEEFLASFGYADLTHKRMVSTDTLFDLASITKVFTSSALAVEILRGRMSLKDPVIKFFPGVKTPKGGFNKITLSDLATHTSSLPRDPPQHSKKNSTQSLISFLEEWKPSSPIGTKFLYSNLGFAVLGQAIANLEKTSYIEAMRMLILNPLNMSSTEVHVSPTLSMRYAEGYDKEGKLQNHFPPLIWPGGGGLRSSARDMLQFLKANLGKAGPPKLIRAMQLARKRDF